MDERQALVPRLRFPEFRKAGEWERKQLSQIAEIYKGKGISKSDIKADGAYPCVRYGELYTTYGEVIDTVISRTDVSPSQLFLSRRGDVVIPSSGETKIDIATAACVMRDNVALGSDLNIIRTKQNGAFLSYYLNGSMRFEIAKVAQGDTVAHLYKSNLEKLLLALPKKKEQQKIADCLSSLDALITAQADKLDALKAHKKGLMQQLFPRESETVPRLRFPEFRDAGEWEEQTLGELVEVASGQVDPTSPMYCNKPHVGGENIESHTGRLQGMRTAKELGLISGKYSFDAKDVLYSKIRPALNKVATPDFEGICSADIYPIRPSSQQLCRQYLAYLLLSDGFLKYATKNSGRSKIPKVNRESILAYELVIPDRAEQQCIAESLSSLDTLINSHAKKLDALKAHKNGLMQQLFPSLESLVS